MEQSEREAERMEEKQRTIHEKNKFYEVSTIIIVVDATVVWDALIYSYMLLTQSAYVDGLEDTALFVKLFEEDNDADKFKHLPDIPELLEQ